MLGVVMDAANRRPVQLALDALAAQDGERVLDIGCGTGAAAQSLLKGAACKVTCVDRSPTMLHRAVMRDYETGHGGTVDFHEASLGTLPFGAGCFDAALALNMLYFCDVDGVMLNDLRRCLRSGGRMVAYVTHRDAMRKWPFISPATHRLYDEAELREALIAGGFSPSAITIRNCKITRWVRGLIAVATV